MHIVYFTHDVLDLGAFSTLLSWAIVIGGVYGSIRLLRDLIPIVTAILRTAFGIQLHREAGRPTCQDCWQPMAWDAETKAWACDCDAQAEAL